MKLRKQISDRAPVLAGVLLGLAVLAPLASGVSAGRLSDEAKLCGAERNVVQAEFDLSEAKGIWKRLPALGVSPELENDDRPAHVVVFKGDYDPSGLQFTGKDIPRSFHRVLCVVQADGTVNLYTDVPRDGSAFSD